MVQVKYNQCVIFDSDETPKQEYFLHHVSQSKSVHVHCTSVLKIWHFQFIWIVPFSLLAVIALEKRTFHHDPTMTMIDNIKVAIILDGIRRKQSHQKNWHYHCLLLLNTVYNINIILYLCRRIHPKLFHYVLHCFVLIKYLYLHAKLGFNIFRTINSVQCTPLCHCYSCRSSSSDGIVWWSNILLKMSALWCISF